MKQKDILFLLISGVILVAAWVIFTILHNSISSTISDTVSGQIVPISGSFDLQTIANLKKRQQVTSLFTPATPSITPTPTLTTVASDSATLTPTLTPSPTATQGGNIHG